MSAAGDAGRSASSDAPCRCRRPRRACSSFTSPVLRGSSCVVGVARRSERRVGGVGGRAWRAPTSAERREQRSARYGTCRSSLNVEASATRSGSGDCGDGPRPPLPSGHAPARRRSSAARASGAATARSASSREPPAIATIQTVTVGRPSRRTRRSGSPSARRGARLLARRRARGPPRRPRRRRHEPALCARRRDLAQPPPVDGWAPNAGHGELAGRSGSQRRRALRVDPAPGGASVERGCAALSRLGGESPADARDNRATGERRRSAATHARPTMRPRRDGRDRAAHRHSSTCSMRGRARGPRAGSARPRPSRRRAARRATRRRHPSGRGRRPPTSAPRPRR